MYNLAKRVSPKVCVAYTEEVLRHYRNPQNVGSMDESDPRVGTGLVGAPSCGDVLKLQIQVDAQGCIERAVFKAFGCGSAIAASSWATQWLMGKSLKEAQTLSNAAIATSLSLPPVKIHCSVLGEEAVKRAIQDFQNKQKHELAGSTK